MKTNIVKQNSKKLNFEIKSLDKQKIVKYVSTTHVGWGFGFIDALLSSLVVFLLLFFWQIIDILDIGCVIMLEDRETLLCKKKNKRTWEIIHINFRSDLKQFAASMSNELGNEWENICWIVLIYHL